MNLLLILALSAIVFYLASRWYGRAIGKILGINDQIPTPAVEKDDGRDFVPTKPHILFAHHFQLMPEPALLSVRPSPCCTVSSRLGSG